MTQTAGPAPALSPLLAVLKRAAEAGATYVHIKPALRPMMSIGGKLTPVPDVPALAAAQVEQLLLSALSPDLAQRFRTTGDLDTALTLEGVARFRINLYRHLKAAGAVVRIIPQQIRTLDDMGMPAVIKRMALERPGLVLVSGPTGSGKSTTLAAMVDYVNAYHSGHIISIEDPIEFVHPHKRCLVTQREVGDDTEAFAIAIKAALNQAPDVIVIGELRDAETVTLALKAAEAGHMVLSTLPANDAVQTLRGLLNFFNPHEQDQIRTQLAKVLQGCLSQRLLPRVDGGRVVSLDLLVATASVREALLQNELDSIYGILASGAADGMMSANQSLIQLLDSGLITYATAIGSSDDKQDFILKARNSARTMRERINEREREIERQRQAEREAELERERAEEEERERERQAQLEAEQAAQAAEEGDRLTESIFELLESEAGQGQ